MEDEDMDDSKVIVFDNDFETTCRSCYAEFLDPEDLNIHISQVHPELLYLMVKCRFCTQYFTDKETCAKHIIFNHLKTARSCKYCARVFSTATAMQTHVTKHLLDFNKSIKCAFCNLYFSSLPELQNHDFNDHNQINDGVTLFDLYPYLSSVLKIKAELYISSLSHRVLFKCCDCKMETLNLTLYLDHLKEERCQAFVCNKCCSVYGKKYYLIRHLQRATCKEIDVKESQYDGPLENECSHCHRIIDKQMYHQHLKLCKPIKCETCDLVFTSVELLTAHQMDYHPASISVFKCQYCSRESVGEKAHLNHIEKVHKPKLHLYKYKCHYCSKLFKHPKILFGHFFGVHKEIKPYTCKICNLTFRVRKSFSLHIKLKHNSEGYVENDEKFHVFFTDKKAEKTVKTKLKEKVIDKTGEHLSVDSEENKLSDTVINKDMSVDEGTTLIEVQDEVIDEVQNDIEVEEVIDEQRDADDSNLVKSIEILIPGDTEHILLDETAVKSKKTYATTDFESNSDDELLIEIRKKKPKIKRKVKKTLKKKRKLDFTCYICKKYCYTYQNYELHMATHNKKEKKRCLKCDKSFKSAKSLQEHIKTYHSRSKLTDVLQSLLERRKNGSLDVKREILRNKFEMTIKKVQLTPEEDSATIKPLTNSISVQKFIEDFTPETNDIRKGINVNSCVSLKLVTCKPREPLIKLKKFKEDPLPDNCQLALPVHFSSSFHHEMQHNVSLKLVQIPTTVSNIKSTEVHEADIDHNIYHDEDHDHTIDNYEEVIPDVAQEVMLENSDDVKAKFKTTRPKSNYKVTIPAVNTNFEELRIAHLMPEAPYFKIVKVKDVIKEHGKKDENIKETDIEVKLPDGAKLVNVNPLAHLLKNKTVNTPTDKYYKPKIRNYEQEIAKAMLQLDQPISRKRIKKEVPSAKS